MMEFLPKLVPDLRGIAIGGEFFEQWPRIEGTLVSAGHIRPTNVVKADHGKEIYHPAGGWSFPRSGRSDDLWVFSSGSFSELAQVEVGINSRLRQQSGVC